MSAGALLPPRVFTVEAETRAMEVEQLLVILAPTVPTRPTGRLVAEDVRWRLSGLAAEVAQGPGNAQVQPPELSVPAAGRRHGARRAALRTLGSGG